MIKLIDNYEIHGRHLDYSLMINTGKTNKNGKPVLMLVGYYRSVAMCIKACYKDAIRKITAEEEMTLTEAVERFETIEKRLEDIMPGCFKI